jgi:hypothetical protein
MAAPSSRSPGDVRLEIASERQQLAEAVDSLRAGLDLRGKLPVLAAAATGAGFLLAGGIGATMRLLARKSREP